MILFDIDLVHPVDVAAAYGWSATEAGFYLGISAHTFSSYSFQTKNRRTPTQSTQERAWERTRRLIIEAKLLPLHPEKLPRSLQVLLKS